jgi:hypothetical protein
MPVTLTAFDTPVRSTKGVAYAAKACARQRSDGLWEGWIEFEDTVSGRALRTTRETTQPNLQDISYWATGLTNTYLEGALERALPPISREEPSLPPPAFDGPAEPEKIQRERID